MQLARFLKGHESCSELLCFSSGSTKCCNIATNANEPTYALDDYYIYELDNVVDVGVQPRNNYGWDVSFHPYVQGEIEQVYFCIDGIYHETWPHWVTESAILLVLYDKIKEMYPNVKLFSFGKKHFKNAMYASFSIPVENVVYTIDAKRNRFVFPKYISLADHRNPFLYLKHMKNFFNYIVSRCPTKQKDIEILYLPRGSKENSKGTERQIPVQSGLIDFLSNTPGVKILYTDETTNMIEQWDIVRRAKIIILNEGGNHGVNGFFAENSKIIVLGGHGAAPHFQNPSPALVYYDSVNRGNQYYHIEYNFPLNAVLNFIGLVANNLIPPIETPKITCWRGCHYCKHQDYSKAPLIHSV